MRNDKKRYTFKQNMSLILRGLRIYSSFSKPILLSKTCICIVNAIVPFINIYFSAQIINEIAGNRDKERLTFLVLVTIGLNLLAMLLKSLTTRWMEYCDSTTWVSVQKVYSDKLLSMDYIDVEDPSVQQQFSDIRQHHNGMGFGLIRLNWSYSEIITGFIQVILSIVMSVSMFTFVVTSSSSLSYLDSPIAMVIVVAVLLCSVLLAPYLSLIGGKVWAKASEDNNKANRIFGFYFFQMINKNDRAKDIRIYDQYKVIEKATYGDSQIAAFLNYASYDARYKAISTAVSYLSNGLIYLFVALKAFAGAFGVGSIVQYVGAITQFGSGFASVLTGIGSLINNNVFLENIFNYLDIENKKYQGTLSVEKRDDNEYSIEFKDVSFKYPSSDSYALKDFNLKLKVGQRMAVVGLNGSGKTTMIKLLCRLYDPTKGIITLNGIDIKKYNYDEYIALFSVVFQDFSLLPLTVGQNVAASAEYDRDRVTKAIKKAGLLERLEEMDKGLDTYLYKEFEEEGVEISGGEAQKLALARALYKDAPFIVLDEPTAALDPVAEFEIYSKFNDIVSDKTAIYISHRLSSCRFCDDIAVFDNGALIQRGSHEALVADENGKYYELWNAQAQYYTSGKD